MHLSEERKIGPAETAYALSTRHQNEVIRLIEELKALASAISVEQGEDISRISANFTNISINIIALAARLKAIETVFQNFKDSISAEETTRKLSSNGPRCILHLEDAVTVIRSLAHTSTKNKQAMTKSELEIIIGRRCFLALTENLGILPDLGYAAKIEKLAQCLHSAISGTRKSPRRSQS